MTERLIEERVTPKPIMAVRLLTDLISAQTVSYKAQLNPLNPTREEKEAIDISRRKFEATLESTVPFFYDKNYGEALKTVRMFLKAKHLGVLDAVRVWTNHGQIDNSLHIKAVFDYIRNLGIKKDAMDFLALGLPLYEKSLPQAE